MDRSTGLGNRQLWDRLIGAEQERCRRYGSPSTVISLVVSGWLEGVPSVGPDVITYAGSFLGSTLPDGAQAAHLGEGVFAIVLTEGDRGRGSELASLVAGALAEELGAELRQGQARLLVKRAQLPDALMTAFQPVVDMVTGEIVGYGALSRLAGADPVSAPE